MRQSWLRHRSPRDCCSRTSEGAESVGFKLSRSSSPGLITRGALRMRYLASICSTCGYLQEGTGVGWVAAPEWGAHPAAGAHMHTAGACPQRERAHMQQLRWGKAAGTAAAVATCLKCLAHCLIVRERDDLLLLTAHVRDLRLVQQLAHRDKALLHRVK